MSEPDPDKPDPPPVARGRMLPRPDAYLDKLAEVTPDDIEDARAWWRRVDPAGKGALLDAPAAPGAEGAPS